MYPVDLPTKDWFAAYTERFDTVELNTTFYRLPRPSTVEGWRERAPEGFLYAVKVGQFGSHRMKLRDPAGGWQTISIESPGSATHSVPTSYSSHRTGDATPRVSTSS